MRGYDGDTGRETRHVRCGEVCWWWGVVEIGTSKIAVPYGG